MQEGRKVFREVVPLVSEMILDHARDLAVHATALKRLWLHQANLNMNELIARKVLGRDPTPRESVIILDEFANTSSAGSIIAFPPGQRRSRARRYRTDLFVRGGIFRRYGVRQEAMMASQIETRRP